MASADTETVQPLGAESTTSDVTAAYGTDLTGKVVLITGTSSGLGIETAREMLRAGATVVGAVRNLEKMEPIAAELKESTGNEKLDILQCDLASLDSVRACAGAFREKYTRLDILVCNAGVMATKERRETAENFEFQFGVCHVGHFLLVALVADLMFDVDGGARLVVVSSMAHKMGGINFDDIQMTADPYNKWAAYGQAKTANILFAREFSRRYNARGVTAFAVHPGVIGTNLNKELTEEDYAMFASMGPVAYKTVPQGAATSVFAAVSPDLAGVPFAYLQDCTVVGEVDPDGLSVQERFAHPGIASYAGSDENDGRLWELSEEMTGQAFPALA